MNIEPKGKRVLIEFFPEGSPIALPDGVEMEAGIWKVSRIGPEAVERMGVLGIDVGDEVLTTTKSKVFLTPPENYDDRKLATIDPDDIVCKVTMRKLKGATKRPEILVPQLSA